MQRPKNILLRIGFLYFLVVFCGAVIFTQAAYLQSNSELKERGLKISYRNEELRAKRGDILACDGRPLVTSIPQFQLYIDCIVASDAIFQAEVKNLATALSEFFGDKTPANYEKILRNGRQKKLRYLKLGNRKIKYAEVEQVRKFPILKHGRNKGGGIFEIKNERAPLYGELATRTLGSVNENGLGVGLEGAYDYALKGTPGQRTVQKISGGDWMPVNSASNIIPRDGYDVLTTLDIDIQDATETALRDQLSKVSVFEAGTAIIMDVKTGEIRAIANMTRMPNGNYADVFNYAIGQATEPGSTFKLATLIALLEDELVSLEDNVNTGKGRWAYNGHVFQDTFDEGYGVISVQEVFEKSSNVGFAKLAVRNYLGKERQYVDRLYAMKLNDKLGLPISGEATPRIRYISDKLWSGLSLPMMSIGYEVLLTPIMTLTLYNAVANDGRMVKPKFVSELRQGGKWKKRFATEVISASICSRSTLEKVQQALLNVVERGTAKNIHNKYYKIAGKTGTSRIAFDNVYVDKNGYKKHQASFAGFFPAEKPQYSGIVVLYTGKTKNDFYGATWAAPVFKQIADKIYVSHPEWEEEITPMPSDIMIANLIENNTQEGNPKKITNKKIPSVIGKDLKDALFLLENQGMNVVFSGAGHIVKQSLSAGTPVMKGQTIELELR